MVPEDLLGFFQSSIEAGGALIGLLFVVVTVAPAQARMHAPAVVRRGVTANTFTALANAFFVSLVALLPTVNLGIIAVVMGVLALTATALVGLQVVRLRDAWKFSRWHAILVGLGVYGAQLVEGARLLRDPADTSTVGVLAALVVASCAAGLWRAWDLLGGLGFYWLGHDDRAQSAGGLQTPPRGRTRSGSRTRAAPMAMCGRLHSPASRHRRAEESMLIG